MASVLVLGGGLTQCDAIESALRHGHDVIVADGNPRAPGMLVDDSRLTPLEVSFTEVEALLEQLSQRALHVDAVIPYGSDLSVVPASVIAGELGLRGLPADVAEACTDKVEMRLRWEKADVPVLPYAVETTPAEAARAARAIGLPVVVKPPDNAAQRGVQRVDDDALLEDACREALACSPSGRILVEEHVEGPELAVTTFAGGGVTLAIQVTDRVCGPPPFLGICLAHVYPSELPAAVVGVVEETVVRAAEALGVTEGPTYSQVRVRDGVPFVLETGARLGGGRDSELRRLLSGQDAVGAHLRQLLGEEIDVSESLSPKDLRGGGCVRFLVSPPGRLRAVEGLEEVRARPSVRAAGFFFEEGHVVPELRSGAARAGYVIATAPTREEAVDEAERAASSLRFVVEEPDTN